MTHKFLLRLYAGDAFVTEVQCLSAMLEHEAYTPYAAMAATFLSEGLDYGEITAVSLYYNNVRVYYGIADNVRQYHKNGRIFVQVHSKSFTSVLVQNEIVPGMHYDMTIGKIMTGFYTFPHVLYEDYEGTGYIYVRDGASIWDSIVNFGYKMTGKYPYVRGNTVRITPPDTDGRHVLLKDTDVVEYGTELDTTKLVSHFHMADVTGNYDAYQLEDAQATAAQIVRHRQIAFDEQYLSDPEQALQLRSLYAQRGCRAKYVEHLGFANEQVCDRVTYGSFLKGATITRVRMTFSENGVRTKLWAYDDGFYHID